MLNADNTVVDKILLILVVYEVTNRAICFLTCVKKQKSVNCLIGFCFYRSAFLVYTFLALTNYTYVKIEIVFNGSMHGILT